MTTSKESNLFQTAVKVNDQVITNYEIFQRKQMMQAFGEKNITQKNIINLLINERLYIQAGIELNISPSENDVKSGINDFAARGKLTAGELLEYLKLQNISTETFKNFIKVGITWREVIRIRFKKLNSISKKEIDIASKNENFTSSITSTTIKYAILTLPYLANKKNKVLTIRNNVDNCLDMRAISKRYNESSFSIVTASNQEILPSIAAELIELDINETKKIVNSQGNISIIMLCSRRNSNIKTDRKTIRNMLINKKLTQLGNNYLQELKDNAFIIIK
tara:strand:- start:1490 stop:2326 length:837 start_codon:yes stop_codon:yes gene_type:complete